MVRTGAGAGAGMSAAAGAAAASAKVVAGKTPSRCSASCWQLGNDSAMSLSFTLTLNCLLIAKAAWVSSSESRPRSEKVATGDSEDRSRPEISSSTLLIPTTIRLTRLGEVTGRFPASCFVPTSCTTSTQGVVFFAKDASLRAVQTGLVLIAFLGFCTYFLLTIRTLCKHGEFPARVIRHNRG